MNFVPLALVTSTLSALIFVVAVLCLRSLFRGCFSLCALAVGTQVLGRLRIHGLRGVCFLLALLLNTSFQWTAYGSR